MKLGQLERLLREGEPIQVVQKTSAQCSMPGEVPIPIDSNHSDMVKFSSPEERAFRSVIKYMESLVEKRSRESLKQSLERSIIKQECSFYVDQKEYHHRFLEPSVTAYAEGIFLASNNLDYERWRVDTDPSHTLVYSGFPSLAHALPIFLQDLAKVEKESLILNFSYGSACTSYRYDLTLKGANHKDLCMAWTLFCQATDSYSQDVQQQLFLSFLRVLLAPMNDDELSRVYDDPEEAFTILMGLSSLETILEALEKSLAQVVTIRVSQNNGCSKLKRDIKMILDLDEPSTEHWKELFPKIRTIIRHLRKDGITAKVLIMDPPVIGNLELVPGSEIHVTYDKERQDCLTTLYFHNSRSEKVPARYAHTFEWLWKTPEYLAWNSTQECGTGLLLIEGKPGSGKSTLMRFFKDRFSPVSSNKIILASFFYHARDGDSERNHTNMLRALLYQILEADESFFACVQPIYRQALRRDELWDLERLKEALRACRRHVLSRSLFLIVDAMDESENTDRTDIIQFFQKLTERTDGSDGKCLVKVFLTSRPINELHPSGLNGVYRIVLQERNKKDIESYTDAFLQNSVFDSVGGAKPALKEYIMEHADGVFLWVHLVAKELVQYAMKGSRQGKLLKFLKSLPKSLEDFYQRMLEGLDSDDPDDLVDGKRILQFCLFSHRAMELHELEHALAMPGLPKDPEPEVASWEIEKPTSIRRLLTQCTGGFVDIQESR
ncbi:hypothetical protein P167DRAFT_150611 [Morchella conica CCBAS932]|uniref:NACHT domain-containing protein n=1 Tax=Morchella conica CCBAS932 TaxID=1392247 RepID=A0A3N4KTA4_9PEZI|nr:hypothetical protein P167DRAFT_150611 [Morchella conica CCBAS932]